MPTAKEEDDVQKVRRRIQDERVVDACDQIRKWLSIPQTTKTTNPGILGAVPPKDCATPPHSKEASRISAQTPSIPSITNASPDEQHKHSPASASEGQGQAQTPDEAQTDPDDDHFRTIVSKGSTVNGDLESNSKTGNVGAQADKEPQSSGCYVSRWLVETGELPCVSIKDDIARFCSKDIDTCTGEFLPEIEHPTTMMERQDGPSKSFQDLAWRQAHMSSELHIQREISAREKIAAAVRSQVQDEQAQTDISAEHISKNDDDNNRNNSINKVENNNTRTADHEEPPWPRANCTVRPAEPKDFAQIAAIMTLESAARECPQIVEARAVIRPADVVAIFHSCRKAMQPFVVATSPDEQLLDRSRWPAGADADGAYDEYLAWRRAARTPEAPDIVFGFAFLGDARPGVLAQKPPGGGGGGGGGGGSRFSCQVRVAVHPEHRGRAYGSALLDRMLLCAAPYHRSALDYAWRTDRGLESEWLDLALWALEAQPAANIHDGTDGTTRRG
ncbi:hypothetical protein ESCO_000125 [Escovopsis weberi]|uniref:Uncharacterized protein n=1 Tax=Escovopsis weberi TaxID=150374 RepID=A0A0M8N3I2_ESCWE|nr:hypothetical protein ESCO_000125 [Escovopsis weberi]